MTESFEDLIRRAVENKITSISIETSHEVAYAACWKAFDKYYTAMHADPIEAVRAVIEKALAPKPSTNLANLLD